MIRNLIFIVGLIVVALLLLSIFNVI